MRGKGTKLGEGIQDFYVRDFYVDLWFDSGFLHLGLFHSGKVRSAKVKVLIFRFQFRIFLPLVSQADMKVLFIFLLKLQLLGPAVNIIQPFSSLLMKGPKKLDNLSLASLSSLGPML